MRSTVFKMNMGKRIKAELDERGMKPAELEAVKADSVLTEIISVLSLATDRDKAVVLALARALTAIRD